MGALPAVTVTRPGAGVRINSDDPSLDYGAAHALPGKRTSDHYSRLVGTYSFRPGEPALAVKLPCQGAGFWAMDGPES